MIWLKLGWPDPCASKNLGHDIFCVIFVCCTETTVQYMKITQQLSSLMARLILIFLSRIYISQCWSVPVWWADKFQEVIALPNAQPGWTGQAAVRGLWRKYQFFYLSAGDIGNEMMLLLCWKAQVEVVCRHVLISSSLVLVNVEGLGFDVDGFMNLTCHPDGVWF